MMQEFIKFLNRYKIRKKFFEIIIDNANNNRIVKNELNKVLNRQEYIRNRMQNFISCLTHIFNLNIQDFIIALSNN